MDDLFDTDILYPYNEKLEAECVLRSRSILDDFLCPETGLTIQNSQRHLVMGIKKLWSLTVEMKRLGKDIHPRLCLLPLSFMLVLLKILEAEYISDETGKMEVDSSIAEAILQLFYEVHDKLPLFEKRRDTRIASRSLFLYLRHLIKEFGAGDHIKSFSHAPIVIENGRLKAPFRANDLHIVLGTMRHFRDSVLKKYNRGPVKFGFVLAREVLDIMEPTRKKQLEIADMMNVVSLIFFAVAIVCLLLVMIIKAVSTLPDPQTIPNKKPIESKLPAKSANSSTAPEAKTPEFKDSDPYKIKLPPRTVTLQDTGSQVSGDLANYVIEEGDKVLTPRTITDKGSEGELKTKKKKK